MQQPYIVLQIRKLLFSPFLFLYKGYTSLLQGYCHICRGDRPVAPTFWRCKQTDINDVPPLACEVFCLPRHLQRIVEVTIRISRIPHLIVEESDVVKYNTSFCISPFRYSLKLL